MSARDNESRKHASATVIEAVVPMESDGISVNVLRLPPHGECAAPDRSQGSGQYWLVIGGSQRHAGMLLATPSVLFVTGDDAATSIVAGADGLDLLVLQFPRVLYSDRITHSN
jgi:hypothetical protein